jgi:hypothetical protein
MPGLRTIAGLDDRQAADRVAVEGAGVRQPREPCRQSTFDASNCDQPWRWNLDYVVDVRGNTMSLWYTKETNNYGRNLTPTKVTPYTRGGYLARIDYGTDQRTLVSGVKTDTVYRLSNPPSQVVFTPADRCLSGCATHDEAHWPDTPWDQNCSASPCTGIFSPTFWSTKRLATVKTRVWGGTAWRDVESWTLEHSFPLPGDTTRARLWLHIIKHSALVGSTIALPDSSGRHRSRPRR